MNSFTASIRQRAPCLPYSARSSRIRTASSSGRRRVARRSRRGVRQSPQGRRGVRARRRRDPSHVRRSGRWLCGEATGAPPHNGTAPVNTEPLRESNPRPTHYELVDTPKSRNTGENREVTGPVGGMWEVAGCFCACVLAHWPGHGQTSLKPEPTWGDMLRYPEHGGLLAGGPTNRALYIRVPGRPLRRGITWSG
jgi:hypothetical protein